ncbi:MAG: hypothetical protein U7123_09835 [Potamolinea sp.]
MQKWLLPSLSEVLANSEQVGLNDTAAPQIEEMTITENGQRGASSRREKERAKAEREWKSAIASLEELLWQFLAVSNSDIEDSAHSSLQGLVLAGPAPVLSHPNLLASFQTGIFTSETFNPLALMPFQLPPAKNCQRQHITNTVYQLPLLPGDPLTAEQFCLVFTNSFSLVMVCGEDLNGVPAFRFSFAPEDMQQAWIALRPRMLLTNPHQFSQLETLLTQFAPPAPDYRIVMQFGRQLLKNLPEQPQADNIQKIPVLLYKPKLSVSTTSASL